MTLRRNKLLSHLLLKINERTLRERILILLFGMIFIWFIFDIALLLPHKQKVLAISDQINVLKRQTIDLRTQILSIQNAKQAATPKETSQKKQLLEKQMADLNREIKQISEHLVKSSEMASLLENFLSQHQHLKLIEIKNLPPQSILSENDTKEAEKLNHSALFIHPLVLIFEGSYFQTIQYLENLEKMPWRFFWDELDYQVIAYPEARITLKLHTMSEEPGWLGI